MVIRKWAIENGYSLDSRIYDQVKKKVDIEINFPRVIGIGAL
jgi:hypothetical protein